MSVHAEIVEPSNGRVESWVVGSLAIGLIAAAGIAFAMRSTEDTHARLLDWQISAFYDLNATDQAVYNALLAASEELWLAHGEILYFGTEEQKADPWPTVKSLDEDYFMPPFARDLAWQQQGRIEWERIASFSFEGSAVYFGSGGTAPGQSAYLLQLSHVHKGASYTDGATVWVHTDPNVAAPDTVKRDSLIVNGWREVVPYSGAMEVERLRGG